MVFQFPKEHESSNYHRICPVAAEAREDCFGPCGELCHKTNDGDDLKEKDGLK